MGFTIRNVGQAPSGAFWYSYAGPGGGGSGLVGNLLPGQEIVDFESFFSDFANEVVTVRLVVDYRDEVAESDETNNEALAQVQVICADDPLCP